MIYEAVNISKAFKDEEVIKDFNLTVEQGEFVALVGKSGSGLTTIIQVLAGVIKPTDGEIYFDEMLVGSPKSVSGLCWLRRKQVGYVSTEPILLEDKTVYENLLIAMGYQKGRKKVKQAKAKEVLKMLGLNGLGRFFPKELSMVEKQKVCIGRAMINDPDIIFCDEPTDVLEGYGAEQVMEILEILSSAGYTIIMTTHSKRIAGRSHRIVPINDDIDMSVWEEIINSTREEREMAREDIAESDDDDEYEGEEDVENLEDEPDEELEGDESEDDAAEPKDDAAEEFAEYKSDKRLADMTDEEYEEELAKGEEQLELDRLTEALELNIDELIGTNGFPDETLRDDFSNEPYDISEEYVDDEYDEILAHAEEDDEFIDDSEEYEDEDDREEVEYEEFTVDVKNIFEE